MLRLELKNDLFTLMIFISMVWSCPNLHHIETHNDPVTSLLIDKLNSYSIRIVTSRWLFYQKTQRYSIFTNTCNLEKIAPVSTDNSASDHEHFSK